MGNYTGGNKFGGDRGGKKFGPKKFGGDRGGNDRGFSGGRNEDRVMYRATCSECRKDCEVPFRPASDKPVYCSDCYKNKGSESARPFRDERPRDFGSRDVRPHFEEKRPYERDSRAAAPSTADFTAQFNVLNAKLDRIIKALQPAPGSEETREAFVALKDDAVVAVEKTERTKTKKVAAKKYAPKKVAAKKSVSKKK